MKDRASKAEAAERRANAALEEARAKDREAEAHIQSRVANRAAQLERQSEQKLENERLAVRVTNSIGVIALSVYSVILTLIWAIDHWDTTKTLPQWFVNRGKNIATIAGAIKAAFLWVHDKLPATWPEFFRYLIPILILAGAVVGLVFLVRAIVRAVKKFHRDIWSGYYRVEKNRYRKAVVVAICAGAVPLSVLLVELWKKQPLNWFSWWLIFSIIGSVIYLNRSK